MQASRPQPAMLEGLSRFLVEHEPHGEGFDVAHPAGLGSGRVSITCRGCGALHEYATATIEVERELTVEALPAQPAAEQIPSATPGTARPVTTEKRPPRQMRRSRLVTAGLLALAVAALAFAIVRLANDGGSDSSTPLTTVPANTVQPATPPPAPEPPPKPPAANGTGATVPVTTPAFALRAPRGWAQDTAHGGLLLHPRNGRSVSLQVFFQRRPGLSLSAMTAQTAAFLGSRGADSISPPQRLRVRGDPAFRITARTPNGNITATGIRHGATRYLLASRLSDGASGKQRAELTAVEGSFRPR
jgi:hypothetical protein